MSAALADGTVIRVRDDWPEARGKVQRHLGDFPNPEDLAFARPAPKLPLYHVAFETQTIWPDAAPGEVVVELYEPWLEVRA